MLELLPVTFYGIRCVCCDRKRQGMFCTVGVAESVSRASMDAERDAEREGQVL